MFKSPGRQQREELLEKVLGPLTDAERDAIRLAFISGISRQDLLTLAEEVGLVRASQTLTGGIGFNGVIVDMDETPDDDNTDDYPVGTLFISPAE